MAVRQNRTDKIIIPLQKRIKFRQARQFYLTEESDCYLNAPKSLMKAGYAESTAKTMAPLLWEQSETTPEVRLDPENTKSLIDELNKWMGLMSKWRESLEEVEDLSKLPPATFATISAHIERLSKIVGLIKSQSEGTTVNIQINGLPDTEQYDKLKLILSVLFEKVKGLEGQLSINAENRFILN